MYLPRCLSRHPITAIFESVINTKDLPALFKLGKLCNAILNTFKVIHGQ